jgi:hypothetical protein
MCTPGPISTFIRPRHVRLAVPAIGRVVSGFNPVLVIAIIASPAIVLGVHRAVRRFASRSR